MNTTDMPTNDPHYWYITNNRGMFIAQRDTEEEANLLARSLNAGGTGTYAVTEYTVAEYKASRS